MITQNEDRNRKTKYGHKREGNTGLTLLPPPRTARPALYTIQRGGGGGRSGGLKGQSSGTEGLQGGARSGTHGGSGSSGGHGGSASEAAAPALYG